MAAQDLQIQPRRSSYIAQQPLVSRQANLSVGGNSERPTLLISALKSRWWLFLLVGLASAIVAQKSLKQFGRDSSLSSASLIQTGLPGSPDGGEVVKSLAPATCAELIESFNILNKLIESRDLNSSPAILEDLIETKTSRGSSLLSVEFMWPKADEGVAILNDLVEIFVEEIASQRKKNLAQSYGACRKRFAAVSR